MRPVSQMRPLDFPLIEQDPVLNQRKSRLPQIQQPLVEDGVHDHDHGTVKQQDEDVASL
jgi:hypothetical protein